MKRIQTSALLTSVLILMISVSRFSGSAFAQETVKGGESQAPSSTDSAKSAQEKADLNEKLAKYLTKTRWEGQFTMTGQEGNNKPEYYEIISAEKAETGDYWNLVARIKYGDKDATLPLPPIEIKFAGNTPVITVDQANVPGFGIFDARVLIRQGKYAGTWSHGEVGGHLFGTIKKIDDADAAKGEGDQKQAEK